MKGDESVSAGKNSFDDVLLMEEELPVICTLDESIAEGSLLNNGLHSAE